MIHRVVGMFTLDVYLKKNSKYNIIILPRALRNNRNEQASKKKNKDRSFWKGISAFHISPFKMFTALKRDKQKQNIEHRNH